MSTKDFPRGGKRALEPLEYRELNDELFNELNAAGRGLEEASASASAPPPLRQTQKKRKKNANGEAMENDKDYAGAGAGALEKESCKEEEEDEVHKASNNVKSISMFSFQKTSINSVYFGVVSLVSSLFITITLPNNLKVNCSIMEISSILSGNINKIMGTADNDEDGQMDNEAASDDGAADELPDLNDYFKVGQQVACKVLSTEQQQQGNDATAALPDSTQSGIAKKVVQVTVDPEKVWSHIKDDSWVKGVVVDGTVESKQDYGWNIRLSPTKKAFLKFDKEKSTDYKIGSLVKVSIQDASASSIIKVSIAEKHITAGTVNSNDAALVPLDQVIPGSLVYAKISELCDSGIYLNVFGLFEASIESSHIPVLDTESTYKLGQKVTARVLWVDTISKTISLSLLPHLVGLRNVATLFTQEIGDFVTVKVVRGYDRVGLFVKVSKEEEEKESNDDDDDDDIESFGLGFVHISKIKDTRIAKIDASYSAGTLHKARVIGVDYCNAHLLFSLQPRVLAQPFVRINDIAIGALIKGVVEKVESFGVIVAITESIKALCPRHFLSDAAISHPEKFFKLGATMTFRVMVCQPEQNRLILTHKKSLLRLEKEQIVSEYTKVKPGDSVMGVIVSIQSYGAIVSFFNNVRALAPLAELSTEYINHPTDVVKLGQTVSCRVLSVDPIACKLRVSLKTSHIQGGAKQVEPGMQVHATFLSTVANAVLVELEGLEGSLASIPSTHLCDSLPLSTALFQALVKLKGKKKIELGLVRITKVDLFKGTIEASIKCVPGNTGFDVDGWKKIENVADLVQGDVIGGVVGNLTDKMCFVRLGNVTGVANLHNAADGFLSCMSDQFTIGQSVAAVVTSVERESSRLFLSLKPSVLSAHEKALKLESSALQSLFHARKLIAQVQGKDKAEWTKTVSIGKIVSGKVARVMSVGVEVSLASKVTGVAIISGPTISFQVGQEITCKVLDVDVLSRIVDLKVHGEKEKVTEKKDKVENAIAKQLELEAVVESTKDMYCIVRVPSLGNAVAFLAARSLNSSPTSAPRSKAGQKVLITLFKSVEEDVPRLIACLVKQDKPETSSKLDSTKRVVKNAVDPSLASLDDITFGAVIHGKIQSVKETQLNIRLADNLRGRVHVSEVFDDVKNVANLKRPLQAFKTGDSIQCKVIGFHSLKTHKFLPISHTNPISQIGVELTIRPLLLSNDNLSEGDVQDGKFVKGSSHVGFVQKIEEDCIWVQLSPSILGRVDALHSSNDFKVLQDLEANFHIGQAIPCCHVLFSSDAEKGRLDLSIIEPIQVAVSTCVSARVTQIDAVQGLSVTLGPQVYGKIQLADLSCSYSENPTAAFKVGQFLKATIVGVQGKKIDLSLRSDNAKLESLVSGSLVQGYVRSISNNGCFVSLFHGATARVKISELSDAFVKDWKSIYKVGQLVKGKVVHVDLSKNQIELSLKQSSIDPKMKLLDYSDLEPKTVMSGTVRKIEAFGLFIQLENSNIRGLCHITEAAENPVKNLEKLYALEDRVRVYLLKVDVENRKVSLSLKASYFADDTLSDEEEATVAQAKDVEMESSNQDDSQVSDDESGDEDEFDEDDFEAADSDMEQLDLEEEEESDTEMVMNVDTVAEEDGSEEDNEIATTVKPLAVNFSWNDDATAKNASDDDSSSSYSSDEDDEEVRNEKSRRVKKQEKLARAKTIEKEEELLLDTSREPEMPEDFERLLLGAPNDSLLWIKYMAFQLELAEMEKARLIASRALKTISFREEGEKLNVIVALLNLENKFGGVDSLASAFEKACQIHDPKKIHIQMVDIYSQNNQLELAEDLHKKMVKKFSGSCKIWLGYATFLAVKGGKPEQAREVLKRALQALPQRKHVKLLLKFGQMEFKQGSPERARTVFEGLIGKYSKKPDIWSVYLDMEIRIGDIDICRRLFERSLLLKWSSKKMKFFFKKYLDFEKKRGTEEGVMHVRQAAVAFVQSLSSTQQSS